MRDDLRHGGGISGSPLCIDQAALTQILGHLCDGAAQRALRSGHLLERNRVQEATGQGLQQHDLLQDRNGRELRLCKTGTDPLTVPDHLLGMIIEARAEAREGLQFLELRIREFQLAGNGAVGRALGGAADPGNGLRDIDGRKDPQLEQGG